MTIPYTPRVGDRVRICVPPTCPHTHESRSLASVDGVVVEIADYLPHDHIYAVEYPTADATWLACDDFAAAELEPLDDPASARDDAPDTSSARRGPPMTRGGAATGLGARRAEDGLFDTVATLELENFGTFDRHAPTLPPVQRVTVRMKFSLFDQIVKLRPADLQVFADFLDAHCFFHLLLRCVEYSTEIERLAQSGYRCYSSYTDYR